MVNKWGKTKYINTETGEITTKENIEGCIYKTIETEIKYIYGYTVTIKHIKIIAKQQKLWE